MTLECVKVARPVAAVGLKPCVYFGQTLWAKGVDAPLGIGTDCDQASLAEHPQMAGHRRLGKHGQGRDEVSRGARARGQEIEQHAPRGLRYGREDVHGPEYSARFI
jgi:hypothetical protein